MIDFKIRKSQPAIFLAPMEGVTDAPMRTLLSETSAITHCVSEFMRVTQQVLPNKIYLEYAPELKSFSRTPNGTPVIFQILGGDVDALTASSIRAVELGAKAIDLNFGCPAPTVNRHDGGATLLKFPDRIYTIISTLRKSLPETICLSAKIRLGFDDPQAVYKNSEMVFKAGADWLTIHARTRNQGYRPPVFWEMIGDVNRNSPIPIIANGDIWSLEDFKRCRELTQCEHYMLGRGLLLNPILAHEIAFELQLPTRRPGTPMTAEVWQSLFLKMFDLGAQYGDSPLTILRRVKQWLSMRNLKLETPCFDVIKRLQTPEEFLEIAKDPTNLKMDAAPSFAPH